MTAIKMITAPASEPVTTTEVKTALRIDGTDLDDLITTLITEARTEAEKYLNRAMVTQTWELTFDAFPSFPLKIPVPPLQSVTSFKYVDKDEVETTWDAANYIVDTDSEPGRIDLAYGISLPSVTLKPINGVKIRFVAGYADTTSIPDNWKQAIKFFVGFRLENPESAEIPAAFFRSLMYDRVVPI